MEEYLIGVLKEVREPPVIIKIKKSDEYLKCLLGGEYTTFDYGDYSILYKAMGIALVTEIVRDIAADSGNKSLSNQMIFAGKAAILLIALPVYIQVLEILTEILK